MNILIIEDELRIAKRIMRMTQEFFLNTIQEITHLESLDQGLQFIQNHQIDVVLLDLNLNGENGFDFLKETVSQAFHTIIISAYKDQALQAFEFGVLDFVPKPFNKERLHKAFDRVVNKEDVANENIKYLAVKKRGEIRLIDIDTIIYIKGAGMYSELILRTGSTFLHDKPLEKLEQLLLQTFIRTHKSYLIKITEIKAIKISSGSKYMVELKNNELLPVGRTKYKILKDRMFT